MEYHLKTPITEPEINELKIGDVFYITGIIITARDEAHKKAIELYEKGQRLPIDFKGLGVFHCGPIMKKTKTEWITVAAGPTTSDRMELFQDQFIEYFRPSVIIGKGGMGERTVNACQKFGCVYGAFTGGAALLAAQRIKKVKSVYWLEELGMPECLWVYEVEKFGPLIVTIDSHGSNLTSDIMKRVNYQKEKIVREMK
ncbi:fumarate hydratase [Candidatus Bathyarchaeota archaeon]|nr:fumarate hydratase [Candidatus Bathyarchaeota archaeon]